MALRLFDVDFMAHEFAKLGWLEGHAGCNPQRFLLQFEINYEA